jgi:magnesium-transporting ATPase (P-type)
VIALASKETSEEIYIFQGFIYSTNELQDDTVESIEELNDAGLSLKMVTGD